MKIGMMALFWIVMTGCSAQPSAQGKPQNVVLRWQQQGEVDRFNIYRNGHDTNGLLASVPGNTLTYTDVKPQPNKQFCYTVTSVRANVESPKSNEACVNT